MAPTSQDELQRRVVARMKELTDPLSRWHRSLWTMAFVTTLDELIEVANHTWTGVIREHALGDIKGDAIRAIATDRGIGDPAVRKGLLTDVKAVKSVDSVESRNAVARVAQWRSRIARDYLRNWASYLESGQLQEATVELAARSIVTHLRSLGYSRAHIQGWLRERGVTLGLAELAREAASNLLGKPRNFEFMVASSVLGRVARIEGTVDVKLWSEVSEQFGEAENARSFDLTKIVESRVLLLNIVAADPLAALGLLQIRLDRMLTRAALADGKLIPPVQPIVLETTANKLWRLPDTAQLVALPALRDWKLVTASEDSLLADPLAETLHLLTPHLQSTHGVSLATLWASCEALLGRTQQGGHLVAPRLATVLACAYPRHLAYDLFKRVIELKREGQLFPHHRTDKFRSFCQDLSARAPAFQSDSLNAAALYRYQAVIDDPLAVLKRVRGYLESLFLRVYYHRNFVMHSGKLSSVSLDAVAGLAPVLVAAALNEIVSGIGRGISPHALADRATIEFELIGTTASRPLMSLLG